MATALRTISSTLARLSEENATSTSVLFVASQIGLGVNALNFASVKSMTKIFSLTIMQVVSLWEEDRLAAFARALTDFVVRAVIFDVIVRPDDQGFCSI